MEVLAHRRVAVGPGAGVVQQRADFVFEVLLAHVSAAVNVEVTTRDRRSLPPKSDERTNHIFGDDRHRRLQVSVPERASVDPQAVVGDRVMALSAPTDSAHPDTASSSDRTMTCTAVLIRSSRD